MRTSNERLRRLVIWGLAPLIAIGVVAAVAWPGPEPSVSLYWYEAVDPTAGAGVCAPQWQLLIRTDVPSLYAHTGTSCTAWLLVAGGGGGGGGTVTSITCGAGLTCTATNPITTAGTITADGSSPTGTGTLHDLTAWTGASTIGNNLGGSTDDGTTTTIGDALSLAKAELATATISPTPQAGPSTVNDYAPAGFATTRVIRQDVTGGVASPVTWTGLAGGAAGRLVEIDNISTDGTKLEFSPQNAGSTAANRFYSSESNPVQITPGGAIWLWYDAALSRWAIWSAASDYTMATQAGNFTVNGLLGTGAANLGGTTSFVASTTPAAISGVNNDYAPTNIGTSSTVHQDVSSAAAITGIQSAIVTGSVGGRVLFLENIATTTGDTITLTNEDARSTAANRFTLPNASPITIQPGGGVLLRYRGGTTRWYVETPYYAPTSASNPIFGTGTDGACHFDGVASPVCGATLSGSTYTMTRVVWGAGSTIDVGVDVKEAGYPYYDSGTLTLNGKIEDNGNAAITTAGGAARAAGWFNVNVAGGGGGASSGNGGAGTATTGLCVPFVSATQTGGTAGSVGGAGGAGNTCTGGGGGGAAATNTGGAGGAYTVKAASGCGDLMFALQHGALNSALTSTLAFGTGGGGGGSATGGGGGASGGNAFLAARVLAGSGTVEARGGAGAAATATGGGGGGGAGGYATIVYETRPGTVTTVVTGGAHGTGSTGGGNGGDGGTCLSYAFNLSGDGT